MLFVLWRFCLNVCFTIKIRPSFKFVDNPSNHQICKKRRKNGRVMRDYIGDPYKNIDKTSFYIKNKPFVMQVHFLTAHYISKMNSRS